MIQNDAAILQHFIENWEKEIPDYISRLKDQIISRKILPMRKVGADVMIDVVQRFDRTGAGAEIMAKGAVPPGSGVDATDVPWQIYQILDGFLIHEKDMKLDPKFKSRNVEICLKNIHRRENILSVSGSAPHNIPGIATLIPTGNQLDCVGKWDYTGTAPQFYRDIRSMKTKMDTDFKPKFLLGNHETLAPLWDLSDDTKAPYYTQIAPLFGARPDADPANWMIETDDDVCPAGKVYMLPLDQMAGEFIVSENPTLRAISQQRGGNYPIEMYEWVTVEIHEPAAYVELDTTTEI